MRGHRFNPAGAKYHGNLSDAHRFTQKGGFPRIGLVRPRFSSTILVVPKLQVYMTGDDAVTPTMIIAGVGDQMRTSPILMP